MYSELKVLTSKRDVLRRTRDLLLPRLISGEVNISELGNDTTLFFKSKLVSCQEYASLPPQAMLEHHPPLRRWQSLFWVGISSNRASPT
jgi:hypothetical protein